MIGQTISHYKIIDKLGQGGMGIIYKAEDLRLERNVALKFLPHELSRDDDAKRRFIHEAQSASALQHTNICTIHDIEETNEGQLFIVMDYYEGETLKEKISHRPIKLEEAVDIAVQISNGLSEAHEKGIIHRDIKPANIFITSDGTVKILDFGLAKLTRAQTKLTKIGSTLGTVSYMSPEQISDGEVDNRTDIWSLGIVLYEMLTGSPPFESEYEQGVMYLIINEEPEFITKIRAQAPIKLEHIIETALKKNRDKRFQTIKDILIELQKLLEELKAGNLKTRPLFLSINRNQRRIALMPLKSITPNVEQEWFTDGITDSIITSLAQISGLRVISKLYEAHDPNMPYLNVDPIFDKIRDNTRFKMLIKKMGLES